MSDIESVVSPIASPPMLGTQATFNTREQERLVLWAAKTAMMMDCAFGDIDGIRFVSDDHCHELYNTRMPRNATFVWVGAYGFVPGIQTFRHGWAYRNNIHVEPERSAPFDGYAITWHFGYFTVQVIGFDTEDERFNTLGPADLSLPDGQVFRAGGFTRQIFPPRESNVKWPPPVALEEIGMEVWATQPPYVS